MDILRYLIPKMFINCVKCFFLHVDWNCLGCKIFSADLVNSKSIGNMNNRYMMCFLFVLSSILSLWLLHTTTTKKLRTNRTAWL